MTKPDHSESSMEIQSRCETIHQHVGSLEQAMAAYEQAVDQENIPLCLQAMEAIHHSQTLLQSVIDAMPTEIYVKDVQLRFLVINHCAAAKYELEPDEILGQTEQDVHPQPAQAEKRLALEQKVIATRQPATTEEVASLDDGSSYIYLIHTFPLFDAQGNLYAIGSITDDVTQHRRTEAALRHHTLYDALTGLPNRTLFLEILDHALKRARRHEGHQCAVLFLDLDNFKVVNESLGHLEGDSLLIAVAHRLETCLLGRTTIARFGGDEFVTLLEDIHDLSDITAVATQIQESLARPIQLNSCQVTTSASIGIAVSATDPDQERPEDLLRDADAALHQAKMQGRNCCVVFDTALRTSALQRLHTENALRYAIQNKELCLYYQPIIALESGHIAGFEALVRWHHPERGLLTPDEFIPIAEQSGLITALDRWVLQEACHQLSVWQRQFSSFDRLSISINLSARSLMQHDTVKYIRQVLQDTGLNATSLKIEITESVMMEHTEATISVLSRMRDMGVQLCVDDFGTGYSSLRYLHRFPIHTLKIDRLFVSALDMDAESTAITHSIIALGHTLRKEVVAEGIETPEQMSYLRHIHCEYGQGYLFSCPINSAAAERLLAKQPRISVS